MKIFIAISIIVCFGYFGYKRKNAFIEKQKFASFLIDFVNYYDANISVFKNNLQLIIEKFCSKNVNFASFFLKNNNLLIINFKLIEEKLGNYNESDVAISYFKSIGVLGFEEEKQKNKNVLTVLEKLKLKIGEDIKIKGDLFFKLMLAVGCVISIILW